MVDHIFYNLEVWQLKSALNISEQVCVFFEIMWFTMLLIIFLKHIIQTLQLSQV